MFASLKLLVALILILSGIAAIAIGYKKVGVMMKLIFGKDRYKKSGTQWLSFYLYIGGGVLILIGLLLLMP